MTVVTLAEAMRDPNLLGGPFQRESFWPWQTLAKMLSGERLDRREAALARQCTGRERLPRGPVRRLFLIGGRRAGKDRFLSAVAVHRAALAQDWSATLSPGEQAVVLLLGADRRQAAILRRYCLGLLTAPLLAGEVVRATEDVVEFRNGAALEIGTNDARLIRGRSAIAVLGSECCFWRTEEGAASSDEEVVAAAEPSMAMTADGGLLALVSSPHRKRGLMFRKWRELHGNDLAEDICWVAPSRVMNPALPASVVDKAMADDPARARAEFGAEWREDLTDVFPADVIERATDWGVIERPPQHGVRYVAFTDPAGGTGADSFTLGIAHAEPDGTVVLDCIRERKPRFSPAAVVAEFADLLRSYRVTQVVGDRWASGFCSGEFERAGLRYQASERTKSEVYLSTLPLLLSGRARLLDNALLRQQFTGLERRVYNGGRESCDHRPGQHDDLCNSAAGSLVLAQPAAEHQVHIGKPIQVKLYPRWAERSSFDRPSWG